MKRQTSKRAKQTTEYNKLYRELDKHLKESKLFNCFFCGKPIEGRADHHHINGKENDRLIDLKYLVIGHRQCHADYHNLPVSKLPWFESFLDKLKNIDLELYYRESLKLNK